MKAKREMNMNHFNLIFVDIFPYIKIELVVKCSVPVLFSYIN